MHLLQGFMPMLNMVGAIGEKHLAVAEITAEHAHLISGAEGRGEQAVGVQALQPLAVEPIGFRSSRGALGLPGVDQEDLDAARLLKFEEGNPVDLGGFHRHRGDAAVEEPVGEDIKINGERAETAHRFGGAIRWHSHPVLGFADIDPRRMGVGEWE